LTSIAPGSQRRLSVLLRSQERASGTMQLSFEPPEGSGDEDGAAQALLQWVQGCGGRNIVALTGAGISTESGAMSLPFLRILLQQNSLQQNSAPALLT